MLQYKNRILEILKSSDLEKVTPKSIRQQLQEEFNVDLTCHKSELKSLIFQLLDTVSPSRRSPDVLEEPEIVEESGQEETVQEETLEQAQGKKKRKSGFQKEYYLSKELSLFLKKETSSRTLVTKEVWNYIKLYQLQDPKDKRFILTDDLLFTILKKKRIMMFEMTKIISSHIKEPVEEKEDLIDTSEEEQPRKKRKTRKSDTTGNKKGGWNKEYRLSKQLAEILKTEKESRPQVVKKLWEYIKLYQLQDPKDKRFILTDDLLFKVFKVKRLNGFKMNSYLNSHLSPLLDDYVSDDESDHLKSENHESDEQKCDDDESENVKSENQKSENHESDDHESHDHESDEQKSDDDEADGGH